MVLVDSNVLIDVVQYDLTWSDWSAKQLATARRRGLLVINPIIYSEISLSFESADALENYISGDDFDRRPLPYKAAFLVGRAFLAYRKQGGQKAMPLPDFYIGAHAQIENLTLLTRDANRYRTYFPKVKLIAP
jgi:predicted nucleic acid-binding protein